MQTTNAVSPDSKILKRLIEAGIIPPQCRRWGLFFEAGSVAIMRTEVFVTPEQFEVISKILEEFPEEAKTFSETVFVAIKEGTDDLTAIGEAWARRPRPRKVVE